MKRLIFIVLALAVTASLDVAAQDSLAKGTIIFIDPNKLSNAQLDYLYNELVTRKVKALDRMERYIQSLAGIKSSQSLRDLYARTLENLDLETKVVKPNEVVERILKTHANFTSARLARQVCELSDVKDPKSILPGKVLLLPDLPTVIPHEKKSKTDDSLFYQLINISADNYTSYLAEASSDSVTDLREGGVDLAKLKKVSLWAFRFSSPLLAERLMKHLPQAKQAEESDAVVVVEEDARFQTYTFPEDSVEVDDATSDAAVDLDLSGLEEQYFGHLVVFDEFEGDCSHGHKVVEIIRQTFREYRLPETIDKKITIAPINFFTDFDKNIKFLEDYSKQLSETNRLEAESLIKSLKRANRNRKRSVPEYYLSALFNEYFQKLKPDIITTSFSLLMEKYAVMPKSGIGSYTNLLTASPNYDNKEIEDYLVSKKEASKDKEVKLQPIYDYYYHYPKSGTMIVGSARNRTQLFGSFSKDGEGVHAMGRSFGWGTDNTCIRKSDIGNSFSTPDVAAKLFIAKAFWRSKSMDVNAVQARRRLILASEPKGEFIGKISAAGPVNLKKLIVPDNGFLEMKSGELQPARLIGNANKVELGGEFEGWFEFGTRQVSVFSAIFIDETGHYLFNNIYRIWKKYEIKSVNITVEADGVQKQLSLDDPQLRHLAIFQ